MRRLAFVLLVGGCASRDLAVENARLRDALTISDGERLLAQAREAIADDPGLALALALEGGQRQPGAAANATVQRALDALHEVRCWFAHRAAVGSVDLDPTGERLVTTAADGTACVISTSGEVLLRLCDSSPLVDAKFSPRGQRLLTRGLDAWHGTKLWDLRDGKLVKTLVGAHGGVFSTDGAWVAAVTAGGTATLFAAETGAEVASLEGHLAPVASVAFAPGGRQLITASADGTARIFALDGQCQRVLRCGAPLVTAQFGAEGQTWAATTTGRLILSWTPDGAVERTLDLEAPVRSAANGAEGKLLLVQLDAALVLIDRLAAAVVTKIDGRWRRSCLAANGAILATIPADTNTVLLWNSSGERLAELKGHSGPVLAAAWFPDNQHLVTTGTDGATRCWHIHDGLTRRSRVADGQLLTDGAWLAANSGMAAVSDTGDVWLWDHVGALRALCSSDRTSDSSVANTLVASPDGQSLLAAGFDRVARVLDATSGELRCHLEHAEPLRNTQWSPDGLRIATAGEDDIARLWDAARGELLLALPPHGASVVAAVFDAGGQRIATASRDRTARIHDARDGALLATLSGARGALTVIAFSRDGRWVATGSEDKLVRVYAAADGSLTGAVHGYTASVMALTPLVNGEFAAAGADGSVLVFDAPTQTTRLALHAGAAVTALALSPSGGLLGAACEDGLVRLWNLDTGKLHSVLAGHRGAVRSLAFAPDGRHALTTAADGKALLWPIDTMAAGRAAAPRGLTTAERQRFHLLDSLAPQ